ncbi:NYN domain-containing protein [Massilia sp.]|uniref:NYN domain-containing protein n=1 Tax=Massilia sp. TaxID=1882437 RepID=UPI002897B03B|nr:NYN domain-containing protein [Massilia sp.]
MGTSLPSESRVAVLVDCENTTPAILDYALRMVAQFGRVVIRRGYGNHSTLGNRWQDTLVRQAFTPHLQYQYAAGKNTADIALALDALEAMFDQRADTFCLVTSDSDFAYLCRKLRERGAVVCVVGETKSPAALRNASDHFFEWAPEADRLTGREPNRQAPSPTPKQGPRKESPTLRQPPPDFISEAISLLTNAAPEGKVALGSLGLYLKRTDPGFTPATHGYAGLLDMLRSYTGLLLKKEDGGHYTVRLETANTGSGTETARGRTRLTESAENT